MKREGLIEEKYSNIIGYLCHIFVGITFLDEYA